MSSKIINISLKPVVSGKKTTIIKKKPDIHNIPLSKNDLEVKQCCNKNNFDKIVHISDVHIEPNHRIKEYFTVFSDVYKKIAELQSKYELLIVLTGDILDKKEKISHYGMMLCRRFFKSLAEFGTVVIIAGNHDINEKNKKIDDNGQDPSNHDPLNLATDSLPVYYLQYTGLYKFGSIIFCVSSLCDGKFIRYSDITPEFGIKYIALYHGTIEGSTTDMDFDFTFAAQGTTRFRKLSDFEGYDAVLLGDVHKSQVFGSKKNIAYAGSLIQRDHGESLSGHGLLVWDIDKLCDPVLHPIQNDWGHVQISVDNGKWTNSDCIIPKNPYIKLNLTDCYETDQSVIDLKKTLESKYNVQNYRLRYKNSSVIETESVKETRSADLNIDIVKCLTDRFKEKAHLKDILSLHNKYHTSIQNELNNKPNNNIWRPIRLEFKNLFIYGKNHTNSINFSKNGIYAITAKNANGKSNIKDIIMYALFGKIALNHSGKKNIINNAENEGYVELEFKYGVEIFTIRRQIQGEKKRTLSLYRISPSKKCYNGNSDAETNKIIEEMIGTQKDFIKYNLLVNDLNLCDLMRNTASKRIEIFQKVFNIDIFDKYKKLNKDSIDKLIQDINQLKGKLNMAEHNHKISKSYPPLSQLQSILEDLEQKKKELTASIEKFQKEKDTIYQTIIDHTAKMFNITDYDISNERNELIDLTKKYPEVDKTGLSDISVLNEQLNKVNQTYNGTSILDNNFKTMVVQKLVNLEKQLKTLEKPSEKREILEKQMIEFDVEINYVQKQLLKYSSLKEVERNNCLIDIPDMGKYIDKLKQELDDLQNNKCSIISQIEAIIDNLKLNKSGVFELSKQDKNKIQVYLTDLKTQSNENTMKLIKDAELEQKHREFALAENRLNYLNNTRRIFQDHLEYYNMLDEIHNLRDKLEQSEHMQNIKEEREQIISKIAIYNDLKRLKEIKILIDQWELDQSKIKHDREIKIQINNLTEDKENIMQQITTTRQELENTNSELANYTYKCNKAKELSDLIGQIKKLRQEISESEQKLTIMRLYDTSISKSNLPMELLKNKLPYVENLVNSIIKQYTKYEISIKLSKLESSYDIEIITRGKSGGELIVERLSGFESAVVNLALKKALNKLSHISKSAFFFIDEKTDCFDSKNFEEKLPGIINILKQHYQVILMVSQRDISHISDFQIEIDHDYKNNYSRIVY